MTWKALILSLLFNTGYLDQDLGHCGRFSPMSLSLYLSQVLGIQKLFVSRRPYVVFNVGRLLSEAERTMVNNMAKAMKLSLAEYHVVESAVLEDEHLEELARATVLINFSSEQSTPLTSLELGAERKDLMPIEQLVDSPANKKLVWAEFQKLMQSWES